MQPLRGRLVVATSTPKLHLQAAAARLRGKLGLLDRVTPSGYSLFGVSIGGVFSKILFCHLTEWKYVIWRDGNMSFGGMEICYLQGWYS